MKWVENWFHAVTSGEGMTPADLHAAHRTVRRLRLDLSLARRILPRSKRDRMNSLDSRLRSLGRLLGGVRDLDVSAGWARPSSDENGFPGGDATTFSRLVDDAHTGRELLRALLATERSRGLSKELARIPRWFPNQARRIARAVDKERRRSYRRLRLAHRKGLRDPTVKRLHSVRIALRRARHMREARALPEETSIVPLPGRLRKLQAALGRIHDLDTLLDHVQSRRGGAISVGWLRNLKRVRSSLQGSILEEMQSPKVVNALRAFRPSSDLRLPTHGS